MVCCFMESLLSGWIMDEQTLIERSRLFNRLFRLLARFDFEQTSLGFAGIQLQMARFVPRVDIVDTGRQAPSQRVSVLESTTIVELSVVSVQM